MEGQVRAGLLSTIVSQIALVVVLLLSSDELPFSFSHRHQHRCSSSSIFSLFLHLLTSSEVAASVSLLSDSPPPPKRRRLDFDDDDDDGDDDEDHRERISTTIPAPGLPESATYKACFRMRPSTFEWLSGILEPLLDCRDPVGAGLNLSPGTRLGVALFRLATGSAYADVSRRFGVTETAARFCTKQLCRVLCTNFRFWAAFPPSAQLEAVISGFHALSGLPNCSGAVDCTRFSVLRPPCDSSEEADSVVAQIVVDSSSRILSIATGFSGDKGDARVLRSSTLYKDVEEGVLLNSPTIFLKSVTVRPYIVGDGGYPLLPWLMVPYIDPAPASCEEQFNELHYRMRLPALRTIASLRNWGILSRPIDEEMRMSVACIGACAILHNVLLMREDYSALSDAVEDYAIHDQSSQYYRDASLEECLIEKKASIVRNALAAKAREANAGH